MEEDVVNTTMSAEPLLNAFSISKCVLKSDIALDDRDIFYFDIYYWTCVAVVLVIGTPINYGIVCYEWFGGDTQKRSLVNRFISNCIISSYMAALLSHLLCGMIR